MAEIKLLREAKITNEHGEIVYDFAARRQIALRVVVDIGEHHVAVVEPVPERIPDWVVSVIANAVEQAVTSTIEALDG